ncbi:MAG: tRNA (N(6)-L-threonylcarbamoyladenosine(37)-C(2))-methylthiotransferase MtaB [Myxococcota bacterium]
MAPPGQPTAHVATFGCRVNQADTEGLNVALAAQGFGSAPDAAQADVVVINSCTVTHRSDADIRKLVHRVERENPQAKVIVSGCYAQRDPAALARLSGVDGVVGHASADEVAAVARLSLDAGELPIVRHAKLQALEAEALPPVAPVATVHERTRPFLKIQDGCDARCTYCVIPAVRGAARSAPIARVVAAAENLVDQGFFEIVLAGIHLGTYGKNLPQGDDLMRLIDALLAIPGLGRLRLSAIEPMAFPRALIERTQAEPRLAQHFHLPLQSGSDRVLKRMNRPYRQEDFGALISEIRAAVPDACLATDVIVGFPGETDADFEETLAFVARSGLDYVHVFSYSDRPGVPSTRLPDKQSSTTIKARATALSGLSAALWARFLDRQVGRRLEALTLERDPARPESIEALSSNYCPIRVEDPSLEANRAVAIQVLRREGKGLVGALASPAS